MMKIRQNILWILLLGTGLIFSSVKAQAQPLQESIEQAFDAGRLQGLHGVYIEQGGKAVAEVYFAGDDERWGQPLGNVEHGPDRLHDLRSVTKSIVSLLYGIALDRKLVPDPQRSLVAAFPVYDDLAGDPARAGITIENALTMMMGTEWDETAGYTSPDNSEVQMESAPDSYYFALSRPLVTTPGTRWNYNGGATALIGKLISDGAGMPLDQFAEDVLFQPLGIENYEWVAGTQGDPSAASGLRMTARDLARIGRMVLNKGQYDGKQIVPADWLERSLKVHAETPIELRYGYSWWLAPYGDPPVWAAALGNGGQRLSLYPRLDMTVVVQAGLYNATDDSEMPVSLIEDLIMPFFEE